MTTPKNIFDNTTSESVASFSQALEELIDSHRSEVSANVLYVILHFHAKQCMDEIVTQSAVRVSKCTPTGA